MAGVLVSEGYSLADILDYENGMPFDELAMLSKVSKRAILERRRDEVSGMVVALGSLFDKKIMRQFNAAVDKALRAIGTIKEETREERMTRTMRELNKLRAILGDGPAHEVPPWERGKPGKKGKRGGKA